MKVEKDEFLIDGRKSAMSGKQSQQQLWALCVVLPCTFPCLLAWWFVPCWLWLLK